MDRTNATLAAVGGCLEEVFRGALEARKIAAGPGELQTSWAGEWDATGEELLAIRITFRLRAEEPRHRAVAERVLGFYAAYCPLKKKLAPRAQVDSRLIFDPPGPLPAVAAPAPPRES